MSNSINSTTNYNLYEIQDGDTLDRIARKLNVEIQELRQYHNSRSELENCMGSRLPQHLKFIIIPHENEKEELLKNKKPEPVRFVNNEFVLPFRPYELFTEYSVTYTIEKEGKQDTMRQYYKLKRLEPQTKQIDYHFIQINKISPLLINEKLAEEKVYSMAEKTAELLFPLRIVVDKWGKWIDLNSYYKIKARWEKEKYNLKEVFDGKQYDTLVKTMESDIINDKLLVSFVSGNWFLRAFFNKLHVAYQKELEIEKKLFFPVFTEIEDVEFLITQKVNPYLDDLNRVIVTQEGQTADANLNGTYNATYFLHPQSYIIEHLIVECDFADMNHKIKIVVENLNQRKISAPTGVSLYVN